MCVPTLLFLAGEDRIIDNIHTRRFVESFPSADRQVIEFLARLTRLNLKTRNREKLFDGLCWRALIE